MKRSIITSVILALLLVLSNACSTAVEEAQNETEKSDELYTITKHQFGEEGMQLGKPEMYLFEETITANGNLVAAPDGMAEVNTHVSGIIKSIHLMVGDYVKKGQTLCSIEGNEVIMIQQEFQELSANLMSLKADYDRIKILSKENISSQKELLSTESAYKSALAKHAGLKSRLELLNINPENIAQGKISSTIKLLAPISGYVSKQYCSLGQFVDSQKELMEIVDTKKLQLKFYVFEKDILKLKNDQGVRFYSPEANDKAFIGKLIRIGKSINSETKTIECTASLDISEGINFVNGMFIMVEVISNNIETLALPDEAILKSGDDFNILVEEKEDETNYYFKQEAVKPGITQNGFTAINIKNSSKRVLIKGLYNLVVD
jgi:cobalt-zinc-cadmium efflux system membrane fusion protein